MLDELVKYQSELLTMAKKFDHNNADDLLQETYLKLFETKKQFKDIDFAYIYFTMKSIFITKIRKQKNEVLFDDFSKVEFIDEEYKEQNVDISKLSVLEKQLYYAYFGKKILNDKNEIIGEIVGANLSKISRETGIPYRTVYQRFNTIKRKLCLEMQLKR